MRALISAHCSTVINNHANAMEYKLSRHLPHRKIGYIHFNFTRKMPAYVVYFAFYETGCIYFKWKRPSYPCHQNAGSMSNRCRPQDICYEGCFTKHIVSKQTWHIDRHVIFAGNMDTNSLRPWLNTLLCRRHFQFIFLNAKLSIWIESIYHWHLFWRVQLTISPPNAEQASYHPNQNDFCYWRTYASLRLQELTSLTFLDNAITHV